MSEELSERMNLTEALLFASPEPVAYKKIAAFLGRIGKAEIYDLIEKLNEKYAAGGHSFRIREIAEGFQLCLAPKMTSTVEKFLKRQRDRRLTQAGLETLAVIAYKQPVTRGEIEHIRGVNIDGALNTLLERKLVTIVGRSEKIGHPLLYGTTRKFLEYFGLKNIEELPRLEELEEAYRARGGDSQQELALASESVGVPKSRVKFVLKRPDEEEQTLDSGETASLETSESQDET